MNLRDEVLTMKRTALALVALLAGIVPAKPQGFPPPQITSGTNTVQSVGKLRLKPSGPTTFSAGGLKLGPTFIAKMKSPVDEVSMYIRVRLSKSTRQSLASWQPPEEVPPALQQALLEDLNRIIIGPSSIWEKPRFANRNLSQETQQLMARLREGRVDGSCFHHALARLNRLLLQDSFPGELATNQPPWEGDTIRLVIPASAHTKGRTEMVRAKRAVYEIPPELGGGRGRLVYVVAAEDPHAGKAFIIQYVWQAFYVSRSSGVMAFGNWNSGDLTWVESIVEMAGPPGNLEAAITRFETEFDVRKWDEKRDKQWPTTVKRDAQGYPFMENVPAPNWINLAPAGPHYFFHDRTFHGDYYGASIEAVEMTQDHLRLDMRQSHIRKTASFWINLETRKVVKCVADGKELDLSIDRSGYDHEWKPSHK